MPQAREADAARLWEHGGKLIQRNAQVCRAPGIAKEQHLRIKGRIVLCRVGHLADAASIPAGLAEGQLPIGMQVIGRRYGDADVLAASAAFERLRPWQDTYQLCAGRPL